MKSNDIEVLKKILDSGKVFIAAGKIKQLDLLEDRSVWFAKVEVFPENYEIVARMTWDMVGPDAGIFGAAQENDLVLLAMAPEIEQAFVIRRLSSIEDTIPEKAGENNIVIRALTGKNVYVSSDTKIYLAKSLEADPTEPILLGNVVKTLLSTILGYLKDQADYIAAHTHVGNLGGNTTPPDNAALFTTLKTNFEAKKASPVDDNDINSEISFTEKGS